MKSKFKIFLTGTVFLGLFLNQNGYGTSLPLNQPSRPGTDNSGNPGTTRLTSGAFSIVALPPEPFVAPNQKGIVQSPVAWIMKELKAYVLADSKDAVQKISTFVAGTKPYCIKGKSYKGETASGRLLLSLCVLCEILENGPMTEYQALGIAKEKSSNVLAPDEKLTVSASLAVAITDFNTLSKEIYLEDPQLLLHPTPFISFVRNNLIYLKNAEKKFITSNLK